MQINAVNPVGVPIAPVERVEPIAAVQKPAAGNSGSDAAKSRDNGQAADRPKVPETAPADNKMLRFRQDDTTMQIVAEIVDGAGDLVRQMPSEVSLRLAAVYARMQHHSAGSDDAR